MVKFLNAFFCVFLAGLQVSQGRTFHGMLPFVPHDLHKFNFVHRTAQHEMFPSMEQNSNIYGRSGGRVHTGISRIVGGIEAKKHEFPALVTVFNVFGHFCGASVINQWWVMTAAHCCSKDFPPHSIVAGDHNLDEDEDEEQQRKVERCLRHPQYNNKTMENDIALLKLAEPLTLDGKTVSPIPLPSQQDKFTGECVVMGWGDKKEKGSGSHKLLKVMVPIITDEECQKMYDAMFPGVYTISNSMICAGDKRGGKDACQGDSGGPFLCHGTDKQIHAAGIVSWSEGCARPGVAGVYTEVSYYVDWINDVING